ncbi:alpha/beta hydrolase [Methylobacterium sp. Leaf466]|uniref:alpha/beta hydrolase n=1 Tax=Methylobacterium sp. Leaf466 TaxID=1736386 RepID=UPI0006F9012D|nr:alpha/beta hydrolase [Methylobacterium sp. Leaf466]KQT76902.1 hypothetical protein ASG59_13155 [Methylobacterium sp. Leaf466]
MTSTDPAREGVLLLHGIARRAASLAGLERAFRAAGYATLNLDYPARKAPLEDLVERIAPEVAAFAGSVAALHMATHSMGGLLARALVTRHRPANLGRVVMLGPPNGGSEIADRLWRLAPYRLFFGPAGAQLTTTPDAALRALLGRVEYPLGIIAGDRSLSPLESWLMLPGPDDGRVTVARTKVAGMTDHVTLHATHSLMMNNATVVAQALHFVRVGSFATRAAHGPTGSGRRTWSRTG